MDEGGGVPEDLRCKRSDGKQWRCSALSMPDKTVCEKHYFQAKKRSANSALRASLRTPSRRPSPLAPDPDPEPDSAGDCSDSSAEGLACHQCRRTDRSRVLWCGTCDRRGYCDVCAARWYADLSMEEMRGACPACRGICSCAVCRRGESIIRARIREVSSLEKLKYLHGLLSYMLPVLKKIHAEQCLELDLEHKLFGIKNGIPRARISLDEQMCCDNCNVPIVDYHRHCTNCLTDFCLDCCREVRRMSSKGDPKERQATDRGRESLYVSTRTEYSSRGGDFNRFFQYPFSKWRVRGDGSIRCPDDHCNSPLTLKRIFKINWVWKLAKSVEEMISGCRVSDLGTPEQCIYCSRVSTSMSEDLSRSNLLHCSQRQSDDNQIYTPTALDIRRGTISHFCRHWANGEPIIVRQAFDCSKSSNWDPRSIRAGVAEITMEKFKEADATLVKAIDCLTRMEVDIELGDFIKGYSERSDCSDDTIKMLKLKEWPLPGALEEFLLCRRPEVFKELPLLEFIHPKWGLLNLAAKLPHDLVQTDSRPRLYIAYGVKKELGDGDSVVDLNVNISDTVYVLMHSTDIDLQSQNNYDSILEESAENLLPKSVRDESGHLERGNVSADNGHIQKADAGAIWDVFRRQDAQKLNDYLRSQTEEVHHPNMSSHQVTNPLYDQAYFLHKEQKQKLKEEGIEPWTFKQHVGEAVFIPAGCAFQLRNLKSCVQLVFYFHSPESLSESMGIAQEIRYLPNEHTVKLQMLELQVGKMPLYASSWAIREIQRMILEPIQGAELDFEDRNLTEMVSDNLQRLKRSRIACK